MKHILVAHYSSMQSTCMETAILKEVQPLLKSTDLLGPANWTLNENSGTSKRNKTSLGGSYDDDVNVKSLAEIQTRVGHIHSVTAEEREEQLCLTSPRDWC